MTNFLTPFNELMWPGIGKGEAISSYLPTTILHLTDVNDIGAFAAAAFSNPDKFDGKIVPLASQKLQVEESITQLSVSAGRDIKPIYRSVEQSAELARTNPIITGQLFLRDGANAEIEIEDVEKWGIELNTFAQFLDREKVWVDRTFGAV
jgi:hypothetical protein